MNALLCCECGAPAEFQHPEGDLAIYACAADRCDLCRPLDNQSEHWDGTTPVDGGDTDA
jgi:hypothetical protein